MLHEMFKTILPGELVFDVGAHRGEYTDALLSRGAKVIAVEPQPAMLEILRQKFSGNDDVAIIGKGLGAAPGKAKMHINTNSPDVSTMAEDVLQMDRWHGKIWDRSADIDLITLDYLIDMFGRPKFVKIDVEGYEKQVLLGLTQKVGSVSIEWVPEKLRETQDIIWYMRGLGFKYFNIGLGFEPNFFLPRWVAVDEIYDRLVSFGNENPMIWGDVYAC